MKRLIDIDPLSGSKVFHEYDHMEKRTIITEEHDVEPLLKLNKAQYNDEGFKKKGMKAEFLKVASIPPSIQMKWKQEHGVDIYNKDHTKAIMKLLNDPEYRYLRSASGKY